jgi:phosphoglycerate-specific signal transduction histidine kinase
VQCQGGISENECKQNVTNVDADVQKCVESCRNRNVTSGTDESPVTAIQLHCMLATFMTTMQAENAKLASNLEEKLNKLAKNLDAKLASVSESLDTKLNLLSNRLNTKLHSVIANGTSEMRKENNCVMQEFSWQLQTEVQSIAKEVEVVRKSTDTE